MPVQRKRDLHQIWDIREEVFTKGGFHKPNFKVVAINKSGNPKEGRTDFVRRPNRPVYPVVITREPGKCWYFAKKKWVQGHARKQSKVVNIMVMDIKEGDTGELNLAVEEEDDNQGEKEEELQEGNEGGELLQISI